MSKTAKYILAAVAFFVVFSLGAWIMYSWMSKTKVSIEEQSNVLLEKINTVTKLVSVEGIFSEIYEHKSKWEPLPNPIYSPTFSKKALIIVKAKISVGYDMEKMTFEIDHTNKILRIGNIPDPEIIALEHDLKYYDIQESTFNSFSKDELTALNKNAKQFIREKALESDLLLKAEEQGNKMMEIIEFMIKESGFTVEYEREIKEIIEEEDPNFFQD